MPQDTYYNLSNELDEEIKIDFKKVFMILWSRKNTMVIAFWIVLLFFVALTFILPKKYKVEADLFINKSNNTNMVDVNPYAIEELGSSGGLSQMVNGRSSGLADELEIIKSPLVIDKVIKENDLRIKKLFGFIPNKKEGEYISTKAFLKKKYFD